MSRPQFTRPVELPSNPAVREGVLDADSTSGTIPDGGSHVNAFFDPAEAVVIEWLSWALAPHSNDIVMEFTIDGGTGPNTINFDVQGTESTFQPRDGIPMDADGGITVAGVDTALSGGVNYSVYVVFRPA